MSKFSEKMQEAQDIARATALLEQLNTRLSVGGRNWREKQTRDWCALRLIAINQIALAQLTPPTQQQIAEMPVTQEKAG